MSGKRTTQLDLAGPLTRSDVFPIVQNGRTKQATMEQARYFTGGGGCECTLVSRYTTVGTDANTLKKYLQTYTVPEGVMNVNGNYLSIHATGYFAANGNNKLVSVGIKQDSTGINTSFSIPNSAYNDDHWTIDLRIQRSASNTYVSYFHASVVGNSPALQTPGVTHSTGDIVGINWDAGDVQITVEGTNGGASADDITNDTFIVNARLLDPNS